MENLIAAIADHFREIVRQELENFHHSNPVQVAPLEANKVVFNFGEFCRYCNLSPQSGYKLTSRGEVPCSKRGKRLYFLKSEIDAWLLENKVSRVSKIEHKADQFTLKSPRRRK